MTFGFLVARALTDTTPSSRRPLTVRADGRNRISVDATAHTTIPGRWGIHLAGGGHLQVHGTPIEKGGRVSWQLADGYTPPREPTAAAWTGIAHRNPAAAGLAAIDELIPTRGGMIPAWSIRNNSPGLGPVVAVHVHGAGSTRAGTLRGVLAATAAGLPSVVTTYRNSAEGPRVGRGRSHLGYLESDDVSDVLRHLAESGVERFVLFGWSMGAQLILPIAASAEWAGRVDGVVLDSPALNWANVLRTNLRSAGRPVALALPGLAWLRSRRRARLVGLDGPLPLELMDWVARAHEVSTPVLIHHGTADQTTPITDSRAFVAGSGNARLEESGAGHTVSWNMDPDRWHSITSKFVALASGTQATA